MTKVVGRDLSHGTETFTQTIAKILCIQEAQCATLSLPFLNSDISFSIKSTFILSGSCQLK